MEAFEFRLIEDFKELMRHAMLYAENAHDYIFDDKVDNMIAISYLNMAASKFSAAQALYCAQREILENGDAEKIFHLFETFAAELLNSVRTDHSRQWTSIEFERLREAFDFSPFPAHNN